MKLTGNAVQEVNGIYQEMKWKLEGREITVENVAPMVSDLEEFRGIIRAVRR